MAKQTKITVETESLLILKGCGSVRAWCPGCAAESEMIRLDEAAVLSNLMPREVEQWLGSKDLHRSNAADGSPCLCLNSLLRWVLSKRIA